MQEPIPWTEHSTAAGLLPNIRCLFLSSSKYIRMHLWDCEQCLVLSIIQKSILGISYSIYFDFLNQISEQSEVFLLYLYILGGYKHIHITDSWLVTLTNYPSYQPPDEYSTPSSIYFYQQSTYARALEMHSQEPVKQGHCTMSIAENLFAGVVTKCLQEKQKLMKQRRSRGKTPYLIWKLVLFKTLQNTKL